MPVQGTFLPERGFNGDTSVSYCATDCCLRMEASPTGHECSRIWAWTRACCLNMVLYCHLKPCLAKSTSYSLWPVSLLSQRMTQYHQLSVLYPWSNFTYHTWNSFSEDSTCSCLPVLKNVICLQNTVQWHRETFVTSTLKRFLHTTLHGYFKISLNRSYIYIRYCMYQTLISEWVILLQVAPTFLIREDEGLL